MLPFDRLVKGVDDWAGDNPDIPVFLQIGDSSYEPRYASWTRILSHAEYLQKLRSCQLFVAHVGMGSIIQGLENRKQMLLLPRRADWREHTTDHQLHTAQRFGGYEGICIVDDVDALQTQMTSMLANPIETDEQFASVAPQAMIDAVRQYLTAKY